MDEQPTSQPPANPLPPREPVGPDYWKSPRRRWPYYILGLVVLLVIAGIVWVWQHPKKPAPANQATPSTTQSPATTTPPVATTQSYSSNNFNLSFDYPKNWAVTDNGNGQLSVRSTITNLTAAAGQNVNGQIIMSIAKKGQNLGAFSSGNATAVLDSQKVAYAKPTQAQRADTYLSFLQYANTTATGALDAVYITGDYGYQKGQDIPKTDAAKIDPLVTVTFLKCASAACPAGTATALSIAASSWSNTSFSAPITKMLESLAFN